MKKIARRDLLKAGAAVAAATALPWASRATAQAPARHLVIVLASGGWDTTYSLDPKMGSTEIDAPLGVLQTFGGIPILTDPARPSVTAFFQRYGSLGSVINGVQVRSFVHTDCMKRILTGTPSDANADLGAITAFTHGADLPVPYLVLGTSALSGPLAAITGRAGTTNQLSSLLQTAVYGQGDVLSATPGFHPDATEQDLVRTYLDATSERLRATRGQRGANARQVEAFVKSIERQYRLRDFVQSRGGFGTRDYTPDLTVQTEVALSALEGGLCHSLMLEAGDFDTHQNNAEQSERQEAFFAGLLALTEGLEQRAMLDRTVLIALSEMGRTPKLNDSMGKDHWPVTSAFVWGAGVTSGRVLGGTDAMGGALSMDLATGAPAPDGKQLQTSNLIAGILKLVGVDPEEHFPGVEAFNAVVA